MSESDWTGRSRVVYTTLRILVNLAVTTRLFRLSVFGRENLPEEGAALLMGNHQSNLDPLLVPWCAARPVSVPGKQELFHLPVLGWVLRALGAFPVDRAAQDSAALRKTVTLLRTGRLVCIFPEMTRSRTGEIGEFQTTLTKLVLREHVTVIPVGIRGTGAVLGVGRRVPQLRQRMEIHIGPAVDLHDLPDKRLSERDVSEATARIRKVIVSLAGTNAS